MLVWDRKRQVEVKDVLTRLWEGHLEAPSPQVKEGKMPSLQLC